MHIRNSVLLMIIYLKLLDWAEGAPYFGNDDDDDDVRPESRRKHKMKRKRPCARNEEGKTFFPFQISYINVNYNCNGGDNIPPHNTYSDSDGTGGIGPQKPSNHRPFVNSKPLADQSQHGAGGQNKPNRPVQNFLQNHNGGFFGLFDGSLINSLFGNRPKPTTMSNEEIPVHEVLDDIVPDATEKWTSGQYVTAYNPLSGHYVQDVSNLNPNRVFRQINKQVLNFFDVFK